MRTYWGSDGKFKGYSQNFNPGFGIAYIFGMILAGTALYFLPIVAGIVCLISFGASYDTKSKEDFREGCSLCSIICLVITLISLPIYLLWIW